MASSSTRTPSSPPLIAPIVCTGHRPLWSVMIPAYNCLAYLKETLRSVLAQDPGEYEMQIEVVDDASTDGDVADLVATLSQGRVKYYRQAVNVGSLRNFETCINRATGQWVHILHGDDRVAPGFYTEIASLFHKYPEAGAAFTNTADLLLGLAEEEIRERPPIVAEAGLLENFLVKLAVGQNIETPSVVVKRSVYEQLGSFFAVHYGEDWEMWTRIAAHFPIAYSPKCLAEYRYLNTTSISSRYIREGKNISDVKKVIDIINNYLPLQHRKALKNLALRQYAIYCLGLIDALYETDRRAAFAQAMGLVKMSTDPTIAYWAIKSYAKNLLGYNSGRKIAATAPSDSAGAKPEL